MRQDAPDEFVNVFGTRLPEPPTIRQQNWGAVLSIVIIVLMIIIGAFYAWGKRIAERDAYLEQSALPANY
jgi:hypothetical protein